MRLVSVDPEDMLQPLSMQAVPGATVCVVIGYAVDIYQHCNYYVSHLYLLHSNYSHLLSAWLPWTMVATLVTSQPNT